MAWTWGFADSFGTLLNRKTPLVWKDPRDDAQP
jgi:hypothetical protein